MFLHGSTLTYIGSVSVPIECIKFSEFIMILASGRSQHASPFPAVVSAALPGTECTSTRLNT